MKLKLIAPKKEDGREVFDEEYISFIYGVRKYGSIQLALPTLAGLTPSHVDIEIVDENTTAIDFDDPADIVGITFNTMLSSRAYAIADAYRQRGVTVVLGGIHATVLPREVKQHADAVVIGEAEYIWAQLMADFYAHNLKEYYTASGHIDLKDAPQPRYDLVKNDQYLFHVMQTTRGCPHQCDFCSVHTISGPRYRYKPADMVVREIQQLQHLENKLIFFCDDNFISQRTRTLDLLRRIKDLRCTFFTQCDMSVAKDRELLEALAAGGCRKLFIGFESINHDSLMSVNKGRVNNPDHYYKYVETIQSYGIEVMGGFVFGMDSDTEKTFEETALFIQTSGISYPGFSILTPYPGTKIYQRLSDENRILHHNWDLFDGTHVCFQPKKMSPQALQEGYHWVYEQVYSYDSIFQRMHQLWMLWNESKNRPWGRLLPLVSNLEARDYAVKLRKTVGKELPVESTAPLSAGRMLATYGF
jgi:radical SAM superfamily enzyme YgiQ (UPF0313 family)